MPSSLVTNVLLSRISPPLPMSREKLSFYSFAQSSVFLSSDCVKRESGGKLFLFCNEISRTKGTESRLVHYHKFPPGKVPFVGLGERWLAKISCSPL